MNTSELSKSGYNVGRLGQHARKRFVRKLLRGGMYGVFILLVFFLIASYLARLPRERHARDAGFVERVVLGSKKAFHAAFLTISAEHDDGAASKLPMAELWVRGKRLDRLNEDLPASGREEQKAKFRYANEVYRVNTRYRGDSMNHWAFPQKSFRVIMKKTDDVDGMRQINLTVPRSETQLANWLGYEMARRLGKMLVPDSEMVHFRLNRKFDGIRLLIEQPDEAFLRRRQLSPGKVFTGDINSEQIYGGVKRARLYQSAGAWTVSSPSDDVGRAELASLLRVLGKKDPYRLYYKLEKMIDVDAFVRYMALLEFVGSVHVDATHNGKLYFNPDSGKFSPVVWDTVAYFWGNKQPFDLATNELFKAILSVPEYRDRKDAVLQEMVRGHFSSENLLNLIDQQVAQMRKDVYSFALKLHANDKGVRHLSNSDWEDSIAALRTTIKERNESLKKHLSTRRAAHHIEIQEGSRRARIAIANDGVESIALESIQVKISGGTPQLKRVGLEALLKPVSDRGVIAGERKAGVVTFPLKDTLLSGRSFEKGARGAVSRGVYIYEVRVPDGRIESVKVPELKGAHSGETVAAVLDTSLLALHQESTGWWNPEELVSVQTVRLKGTVTVDEDMILDDYSKLVIEPGTRIRVAPGKSILVRKGGVNAKGTAGNPIIIEGKDSEEPWGVFAVQGGPTTLEHVHVKGGSPRKLQHVFYSDAVSLHNTEVAAKEITLTDATISLVDASGAMENLNYSGVQRSGFRTVRSHLRVAGFKKTGREAAHKRKDYSGRVYGTAARSEREFKLTLAGEAIQTLSLEELSAEMHSALRDSMNNTAMWKAPAYTGTAYYHDEESKDFLFRDIYFDTAERFNYQFGVSYRYRNRYKSRGAYKNHLKRPNWSEFWPYRLEFQAKVDRIELPGGYSTVNESRFEFRTASQPFSETDVPPPPPWEESRFVPYFMDGSYSGFQTMPAKAVLDFLESRGVKSEIIAFEPVNVLVTDRFRQHLNIKTEWGSGPNPDQAYIISLDRSEVYRAQPYLDYLRRKRLGYKKLSRPRVVGVIVEVEMEFERNVSDLLDKQILDAEERGATEEIKRLTEVREAFLSDQQTIKKVLTEHFAKLDVQVIPAQKSKYLQAMDILNTPSRTEMAVQ